MGGTLVRLGTARGSRVAPWLTVAVPDYWRLALGRVRVSVRMLAWAPVLAVARPPVLAGRLALGVPCHLDMFMDSAPSV